MFYFAWVGGITYPAFSMNTTGDLWGGTLTTYGDVWGGNLSTTIATTNGSTTATINEEFIGLIDGEAYDILATSVPLGTTFIYHAAFAPLITLSTAAIATTAANQAVVTNSSLSDIIAHLWSVDGLVVGETYTITGNGIPAGTEFVYDGSDTITISHPATNSSTRTQLTIANGANKNIIRNLASTAGLVVGQTYYIFGPGIPSDAFFVYAGGSTITLSADVKETQIGAFLSIRKGVTETDGGAFDPDTHAVEDERIFALEISHSEGDFASLAIDIVNPRVGLLSAGRNLWCWLSWDDPGSITPLFHGRLIGVPENLTEEIIRLQFIARPVDYYSQKSALADTMKVAPYFDPIFVQDSVSDPDVALEGRTEIWHIDRVSLDVTTTDFLTGEAGTIEVSESEHFYQAMQVSYGEPPLRVANVQAEVTWTQSGGGDIVLTDRIVSAFQAAGSPFPWPMVASYTSEGLLSTWPQPGSSIGAGWSVSVNSVVIDATIWLEGYVDTFVYIDKTDDATTKYQDPNTRLSDIFHAGWKTWTVTFPINPIYVDFTVSWQASRKRKEIAIISLVADIQPVVTDPGAADEEAISLSSEFVAQPIDPNGALPIEDARRNSYFPTDRGAKSIEYMLMLARAKLIKRARVVIIKFETSFLKMSAVTGRHNVLFHDRRLPGGQVLGKVTAYVLTFSEKTVKASITIECAVGFGTALVAAAAGTETYANSYSDDYNVLTGAQIDVIPGSVQYQSIEGSYVLDDDGVDLFNMTDNTAVLNLRIQNGPAVQRIAIGNACDIHLTSPDPIGVLRETATQVVLDLVPVQGGDFLTEYAIATAPIVIPKMIDLEAA